MHSQVGALGEVLAQQPVGVFVGRSLPGRVRLAEEHRHAQHLGDLAVQRHFLALIPGQRPAQLRGQWRQGRYQCVADRLGGVPAPGQVDQDGEPAGPVDQRADRRPVAGAGDQVALPVPGFAAVGGRGGPLADHRHAGQRPGPAGAGAAMRLAVPPTGPQQGGQVAAQPAQLRPVDSLVDRLVHQVPDGVTGELGAQRLADLLRAPPLLQPARHEQAQHRISVQLAATGPAPAPGGQPLRRERAVLPAAWLAVAAQLPADRRRAASQFCRDGPHAQPGPAQIRDAHPVLLRQVPRRDLRLTRAGHGWIVHPPAAAAGDCAAESPAFPRLRVHPHDPARLRATDTSRDQPREQLSFSSLWCPTRQTAHHRNSRTTRVLRRSLESAEPTAADTGRRRATSSHCRCS